MTEKAPRKRRSLEKAGGVQSVEVGSRVLMAVKSGGGPMGLKSIAKAAGLPPANTRRYLVSLIRSGLVKQDEASGKYDLGPVALQIGLAAIMGLNLVRTAVPIMTELRETVGETVVLTIWGDHGPTIIYWEESLAPITVNARIGSVFPLLDTATGHVYLTWLPREQTEELMKLERSYRGKKKRLDIDAIIRRTKKNGIGSYFVEDDMRSLSTLAAPIFDYERKLIAVLTTYGYKGRFDNDPSGPNARSLREAANSISFKMGHDEA